VYGGQMQRGPTVFAALAGVDAILELAHYLQDGHAVQLDRQVQGRLLLVV